MIIITRTSTSITTPSIQHLLRSFSTSTQSNHSSLSPFSRSILTIGSGLKTLLDPTRADMLATFSELTSSPPFPHLHRLRTKMMQNEEGRRVLRDRPVLRSTTVDLHRLETLERGTFGREWVEWLKANKCSPDSRHNVQFIPSPELSYIQLRYRESHDLFHTLLGSLPTTYAPEIIIKLFESNNLSLPVAQLSTFFAPIRLFLNSTNFGNFSNSRKNQKKYHMELSENRKKLWEIWGGWACRQGKNANRCMMSVYWEERWEMKVEDLRKEFGIEEPPIDWQVFVNGLKKPDVWNGMGGFEEK